MDITKYDSIISEIIKTCSTLDEPNNEKHNKYIIFFGDQLNEIYSTCFRHSYSNISLTVYTILNESQYPEETKNNILKGFEAINGYININTRKNYFKLCDHISLEIQHFFNNRSNASTIKNFPKEIESIKKEIETEIKKNEDIKSQITNIKEETSNLNNQLVSILGIFTGIIITFFGGISIISGVFSNMHLNNRFKLIFIIALTGMIIINIVSSLMLSIGKIINKTLHSTMCFNNQECSNCSLCNNKNGRKNKLRMFMKKYPFLIFINFIFIAIMFLDVILWFFNFSHR